MSNQDSSETIEKSEASPSGPTSIFELARFENDKVEWWRDRALLALLAAAVLLPLLGGFGLWDPWETHYGEVGRQITERNDWISTWWGAHWRDAGGSQEGAYFFSKPILLMWMMAMGMEVFGVNEFGVRIGVALVGMLGVLLAYSFGASVFRRRVGWLMGLLTLTSPFWFFLSRQAQTDMPFVGLMTVGLCFFMMGMFGRDRNRRTDLASYALTFGWIGLVTIPQITLVLTGLSRWRGANNSVMNALTTPPTLGVAIAGGLLVVALIVLARGLWIGREQTDESSRRRFKHGLASLATVWVPLLILLIATLAVSSHHGKDLNGWFVWGGTQAAIYTTMLGFAVYLTVARPALERRHLYLFGFYTFVGLATLAKGLLGFMLPGCIILFYLILTREWAQLSRMELLRGIPIFIAVTFPWYAAMLVRHTTGFWNRFFVHDHFKRLASGVHQLDTGSFEHFIKWLAYGLFPWSAFVPAALGRLVATDALRRGDDRARATLMLVLWAAIAFTLFTLSSTKFHHYIFPAAPPLIFLVALTLDDAFDRDLPTPWPLYLVAIPLIAIFAWDLVMDPQILKNLFTYKYDREWNNEVWDTSFRWMLAFVTIPAVLGGSLLLVHNFVLRKLGVVVMVVSGIALAYFCLNIYMPRLSKTWSQQGLWQYYYGVCDEVDGPPGSDDRKTYCAQPVIAYKLNWRGETYYSMNEVIPIRDDDDFTHFVSEVGEQTFYGIMEYARYRGEFQRQLPARFKGKACVVYDENMKFVLAKVPCAPDDPERRDGSAENSANR